MTKSPIFTTSRLAPLPAPKPENYQVWNITAAGPQTVTVPYAELSALINPQGPLAGVAPR